MTQPLRQCKQKIQLCMFLQCGCIVVSIWQLKREQGYVLYWWLSTGCPVWPPSARLTRLPYPTLPPCFLSQCNQIFVYIPNCSNKFKLTFDSISELNLTELIALNWIFNFSSICMGMQYTLKCLFQHTYTSIRYTLHTTHSRKFEW